MLPFVAAALLALLLVGGGGLGPGDFAVTEHVSERPGGSVSMRVLGVCATGTPECEDLFMVDVESSTCVTKLGLVV